MPLAGVVLLPLLRCLWPSAAAASPLLARVQTALFAALAGLGAKVIGTSAAQVGRQPAVPCT